MKQHIKLIISLLVPFIATWTMWLCTACSFDIKFIFNTPMFWFLSGIYWFMWLMLSPAIYSIIYNKN